MEHKKKVMLEDLKKEGAQEVPSDALPGGLVRPGGRWDEFRHLNGIARCVEVGWEAVESP